MYTGIVYAAAPRDIIASKVNVAPNAPQRFSPYISVVGKNDSK